MRRCAALAAALWLLLGAPAGALADGDPASDVLLGQAVFLPYSPVSRSLQARLYGLTAAAAAHGYPVRVALIGAATDLGVVPALFGHPQSYARFLSSELAGPVSGPILVVMPGGFGLARAGNTLRAPLAGLRIGSGTDGLATAAAAAIPRLAAAAGHPLPPGAGAAGTSAGASSGTVRHALLAIVLMALLAAAGIGVAWRSRGRASQAG